jgi:DNA helicase-2/ATP-dependent DNA helicase PcrA
MDDFTSRYNKLNDQQRRAVDAIEGPVLVIAGPGSGKTELLSLRVATILTKTDALPSNILCLTFTEAASVNMRSRLAGLIGQEAYRVAIHTFHGFGREIISRYPDHFYDGATFSAASELDQLEILQTIFKTLPHNNSLVSTHPDEGYIYVRDSLKAIGKLKQAGLTPAEFKEVLSQNQIVLEYCTEIINQLFSATVSMKLVEEVERFATELAELPLEPIHVSHIHSLASRMSLELALACQSCREVSKATPLSKWKQRHTFTNEYGKRELKEVSNFKKMIALSDIYTLYQEALYNMRLFDYDDMLLNVIFQVENNPILKAELQEIYQYVLIDEFQDTNDAQMRLIRAITDNPVHEQRPNLMAVGDDDQAIYKFQGAQIDNILKFKGSYKDPLLITLTHNYRSTQNILTLAKEVINRGEERLENLIPEVNKELIAANSALGSGEIISHTFKTADNQYAWIAKEVQRLLDIGTKPGEIAIIGRHHRELGMIANHFDAAGIPVYYQRRLNILEEPHIRQIICMLRFVLSIGSTETAEDDYLLPEILSYCLLYTSPSPRDH